MNSTALSLSLLIVVLHLVCCWTHLLHFSVELLYFSALRFLFGTLCFLSLEILPLFTQCSPDIREHILWLWIWFWTQFIKVFSWDFIMFFCLEHFLFLHFSWLFMLVSMYKTQQLSYSWRNCLLKETNLELACGGFPKVCVYPANLLYSLWLPVVEGVPVR